jgi:hypothetical protein
MNRRYLTDPFDLEVFPGLGSSTERKNLPPGLAPVTIQPLVPTRDNQSNSQDMTMQYVVIAGGVILLYLLIKK